MDCEGYRSGPVTSLPPSPNLGSYPGRRPSRRLLDLPFELPQAVLDDHLGEDGDDLPGDVADDLVAEQLDEPAGDAVDVLVAQPVGRGGGEMDRADAEIGGRRDDRRRSRSGRWGDD